MVNQLNTPWSILPLGVGQAEVLDKRGEFVCALPLHIASDFVLRVNSHDLLISALTSARNRLSDLLMNGGDDGQAWKEARKSMPLIEAALAKAQGDGK